MALRIWNGSKMKIQFQFEKRDWWVGLFWRRTELAMHLFVCLVPLIPLHITFTTERWIREWTANGKKQMDRAQYDRSFLSE